MRSERRQKTRDRLMGGLGYWEKKFARLNAYVFNFLTCYLLMNVQGKRMPEGRGKSGSAKDDR
jgi:hypothetical protein